MVDNASFDIENWVQCSFVDCPDIADLVERVPAPREALHFTHIEAMAHSINQETSHGRRDVAIKDFKRRVMGLE